MTFSQTSLAGSSSGSCCRKPTFVPAAAVWVYRLQRFVLGVLRIRRHETPEPAALRTAAE